MWCDKEVLTRAVTPAIAAAAALAIAGCKDQGIHGDTGHNAMGQYAEGYNLVIDAVPDMLKDYFENTPADGPTVESLSEKGRWQCSVGSDFGQIDRGKAEQAFAAAKASTNEELKHLTPMADALWSATTEIASLRAEYCKHVQAEDFKDDQAAKAKEYHARWTALAEKYRAAQGGFSDALDKIEDAQMVKDIEKHAKAKNESYWFRHFNHEAKKFVSNVRSEPQNLDKHFAALEPVYKGLQEFIAAKGADIYSNFKHYQDSADRFFADVKKLHRAFSDAKDEAGKSEAIESSFNSIVSGYNSLVSSHNSLADDEQRGTLK